MNIYVAWNDSIAVCGGWVDATVFPWFFQSHTALVYCLQTMLGRISQPLRESNDCLLKVQKTFMLISGCFSLVFLSLLNVPWISALSTAGLYENLVQDGVSFNTVHYLTTVVSISTSQVILIDCTVMTSRESATWTNLRAPVPWWELLSPAQWKLSHESRLCLDQNFREWAFFCQRCQRAKALYPESFEN